MKSTVNSLDTSEWEHAIESEYTQLLKSDIFEWMNKLLAGKKAVRSHIVFKEKLDEHGNCVKFKVYIVAKDFSCCSNHSSLKDKWSHNE